MVKEKVKLAIFDIDFTLTKRETLTEFYMFVLKRKPKLIKYLPKSIKAGFFYIFKILKATDFGMPNAVISSKVACFSLVKDLK